MLSGHPVLISIAYEFSIAVIGFLILRTQNAFYTFLYNWSSSPETTYCILVTMGILKRRPHSGRNVALDLVFKEGWEILCLEIFKTGSMVIWVSMVAWGKAFREVTPAAAYYTVFPGAFL